MEVRAHIKYVRISPIKLRTLVHSLKVMSPRVALDHLGLSQLRTAKVLYQAIKSAVANGERFPGFDAKKARFKVLSIDEGPVLKRYRAGARGMARPYVRKSSHVTVVIEQAGLLKKEALKVAQTKKAIQTLSQSEKAQDAAKHVQLSAPSAKPMKSEKLSMARKIMNKTVTNTQRTTNK